MGLLKNVNGFIDKSCSALVSCAVMGVNLYYFPWQAETVALPVFTSACCATAAVSKVLKRLINQSRPQGAAKLSPGMPSNHATALSFLAVAACAGLDKGDLLASSRTSSVFSVAGITGSPLLAAQVSLLAYSLYATALRVRCGHHTWPQVAVGYALGSGSATLLLYMNYHGYTGTRAGGRVDEMPHAVKVALLLASLGTGFLAFRSILKGSPLLNKRNVHG